MIPEICETSPNVCGDNGVCTSNAASYQCTCTSGYRWDGHKCIGNTFTKTLLI